MTYFQRNLLFLVDITHPLVFVSNLFISLLLFLRHIARYWERFLVIILFSWQCARDPPENREVSDICRKLQDTFNFPQFISWYGRIKWKGPRQMCMCEAIATIFISWFFPFSLSYLNQLSYTDKTTCRNMWGKIDTRHLCTSYVFFITICFCLLCLSDDFRLQSLQ